MKPTGVTAGSFAAVLNPLAVLRPLALLGPLAGIVASLAGALPALGVDVPFTERVISTTANGAVSVFATDVDGDGDTDVLSASAFDDKIAWYENTTPTCGNGAVRLAEQCDDGNTDDGDGCSATCTVEAGWECTGEPSVCVPASIPTVSEWGLIVMSLLVLTAGTLVYTRRRRFFRPSVENE